MRHSAFLLSMVVSITVSFSFAYGQPVQQGLIANWSFDRDTVVGGIVKDLAGNYDGEMEGSPKIIPGRYKEAIEFDGKDDYVDLTILKGFGPGLGTFSIDFWIKTKVTPAHTCLFKTLNDGSSMGWAIDLNRSAQAGFANTAGVTHFYVRDGKGMHLPAEINADIYDDKWHHIGWVVADASSDTYKVYVDGKEVQVEYGEVQAPVDFVEFQHSVTLGGGNNRGSIVCFSPAAVDEFRIYDRALTEAEILQNLSTGAAVDRSGKLSITWGRLKVAG